jgi:hypothetical protein
MSVQNEIVELAAWGFDESVERDEAVASEELAHSEQRARQVIQSQIDWNNTSPLLNHLPNDGSFLLSQHANRDDLKAEFDGLDWHVGAVDLRRLISFQRRLVLAQPDSEEHRDAVDWPARVDIAFSWRRRSEFTHDLNRTGLTLSSANPDLTVRLKQSRDATEAFAIDLHHGSPLIEVGCYRGRWFLRDGYHRAHRLLRSQTFEVPAVVIHARSLEELGSNQEWFFPERILFSCRPPAVTDFLRDDLVLRWIRRARRKVVRVTITEHFESLNLEQERN